MSIYIPQALNTRTCLLLVMTSRLTSHNKLRATWTLNWKIQTTQSIGNSEKDIFNSIILQQFYARLIRFQATTKEMCALKQFNPCFSVTDATRIHGSQQWIWLPIFEVYFMQHWLMDWMSFPRGMFCQTKFIPPNPSQVWKVLTLKWSFTCAIQFSGRCKFKQIK